MQNVARFQNVLVEVSQARGQPCVHWPDFESQTFARFSQFGKLIDTAPVERPGPETRLDAACVWIGTYDRHYGHFISETVSRIPVAAALHADKTQVFNVYAGFGGGKTEPHFRQILQWFGVPDDKVHLIAEKTRISDLTVFETPEHLGQRDLWGGYLDLLDANDQRNRLEKSGGGVVYVSRSRFDTARGRHAGEGYLVERLLEQGVRVIWPEEMTVEDQIREMVKADHLVLAEGSAVYTRQLAGRSGQTVYVMRRRPGSSIGFHLLSARVGKVRFVETVASNITFRSVDGTVLHSEGMALFDLEEVFRLWSTLGIDLAGKWNKAMYEAARDSDMAEWLSSTHRAGQARWRTPEPSRAYVTERFVENGLGELI